MGYTLGSSGQFVGGSSEPLRARVPVDLWITSLLPTGPTGQAGDLWTTSLLPTDPQPYRDCDDRTARGPGRLVSSRSDLWEDGTWSRASMLRPRSLYPSVQLTLELVGCSINAGTLPVTYVSGPDISILPNHRTFLICLDTEKASAIFRRTGWPVILRGEIGPRRGGKTGPGGFVGTLEVPGRECGGAGQEALTGRKVRPGIALTSSPPDRTPS